MAIDISELTVIFVSLNNYIETPIMKFIHEYNLKILKGAEIVIIDENNYNDYIVGKHDVKAREIGLKNFVNDEMRLYFNKKYKYPLYLDLDIIISKELIDNILKNPLLTLFGESTTAISYFPNEQNESLLRLRKFYEIHKWTEKDEMEYFCDNRVIEYLQIKSEVPNLKFVHITYSYFSAKFWELDIKKILFTYNEDEVRKPEKGVFKIFISSHFNELHWNESETYFSIFNCDNLLSDIEIAELCKSISESVKLPYTIDYQPS